MRTIRCQWVFYFVGLFLFNNKSKPSQILEMQKKKNENRKLMCCKKLLLNDPVYSLSTLITTLLYCTLFIVFTQYIILNITPS